MNPQMSQQEYDSKPAAFRVTYTDGTGYITDMAAGTTLEQAKAYLMGHPHVTENFITGEETRRYVATVEQIR